MNQIKKHHEDEAKTITQNYSSLFRSDLNRTFKQIYSQLLRKPTSLTPTETRCLHDVRTADDQIRRSKHFRDFKAKCGIQKRCHAYVDDFFLNKQKFMFKIADNKYDFSERSSHLIHAILDAIDDLRFGLIVWSKNYTTSKFKEVFKHPIANAPTVNVLYNSETGKFSLMIEKDSSMELEAQFDDRQQYIRHPVASDGDCGYTAFGISRDEAFRQLNRNLTMIRNILSPAIKEALLTQNFYNYLIDNELIDSTITHETVKTDAQFATHLNILRGYVSYDVSEKQIDAGWAHPSVLQALAHIQKIALHIWRLDERGELVPHRSGEFDYAEYIPPHVEQRADLLFVNNNHFERLEFPPNDPHLLGLEEGELVASQEKEQLSGRGHKRSAAESGDSERPSSRPRTVGQGTSGASAFFGSAPPHQSGGSSLPSMSRTPGSSGS